MGVKLRVRLAVALRVELRVLDAVRVAVFVTVLVAVRLAVLLRVLVGVREAYNTLDTRQQAGANELQLLTVTVPELTDTHCLLLDVLGIIPPYQYKSAA